MSLPDSSSASSRSQRSSIGSDILMYVPNYVVPNSPTQRDADCLNVQLQVRLREINLYRIVTGGYYKYD